MTAAEVARVVSMPLSTVLAVLTRIGVRKLSRLEPPEHAAKPCPTGSTTATTGRSHGRLDHQTPLQRLEALTDNNPAGSYTDRP